MDFESRCAGRSEGDVGRNCNGRQPVPNTNGAGGVAPDTQQIRPMSGEQ